MNRVCILDSRTNYCINVLYLDNESEWKDHAYFVKAPRNDGEIGWQLTDTNEWDTKESQKTLDELIIAAKQRRNKYLQITDKYMLADYPISDEQRQLWADYRQQLRDLTLQADFPHNINWPVMPTE